MINDIEEKQRRALKGTVEGEIRSTNTSPILEVEEQAEEVTVPDVTSQTGTMQADTQEDTLQPESSEIEDTRIKKVDTQRNQNTEPTDVDNTSNTDEKTVSDSNGEQTEDMDTI